MSQHQYTTPQVVYLGQAYVGKDDREPHKGSGVPQGSDRPAGAPAKLSSLAASR